MLCNTVYKLQKVPHHFLPCNPPTRKGKTGNVISHLATSEGEEKDINHHLQPSDSTDLALHTLPKPTTFHYKACFLLFRASSQKALTTLDPEGDSDA